jgi:hypothetical protein
VSTAIPVGSVRYVKELYPRLKPIDDVIERYRDSLENLPPIVVARDGVLVDGYHRWQAHVREGRETIQAENLGNLTEAEIVRESIERNAKHGQQLSRDDKKRMAVKLWPQFIDLGDETVPDGTDPKGKRRLPAPGSRTAEIMRLLAVSERSVQAWTKDARQKERQERIDKACDLWLDCLDAPEIAIEIGLLDADADADERDNKARNVREWIGEFRKSAEFSDAPESRQHFDVWQFATANKESGQQSYFGAVPPQVIENLLWFFTDPGDTVVDLFAGSGTTVDVAKRMGRRVWAADIRGNHYSPHLPIHQHDATTGWPESAPRRADLVFLDPPYWKQAAGRYSTEPSELAEMELKDFYEAWYSVTESCMGHASRIAYIISPTENGDGTAIDHATEMLRPFMDIGWRVERRIIVPYSTQQATGQQVTWARENKRMLKLYRDLVVLTA